MGLNLTSPPQKTNLTISLKITVLGTQCLASKLLFAIPPVTQITPAQLKLIIYFPIYSS